MAKKTTMEGHQVDFEEVVAALAKAVTEGDIVNFRLLFLPFSPARETSTETFDMPKYAYLLPDDEQEGEPHYKISLALVKQPEVVAHVRQELAAKRPAQLPAQLLLALADNAVRLGKYTAAAQAYEMLRVRARMQRAFFEQADAALDEGAVATAVNGYIIATGLAYDYAAFPEPLPVTPDFQTRALVLHADYPEDIMTSIGLRDDKTLLRTALSYLLLDPEVAARLDERPFDVQLAFLKELVRRRDPEWDVFLQRYRATLELVRGYVARFSERRRQATGLSDEIAEQLGDDPSQIPASILGRAIEPGEWWQYIKELAGEHPPAVLFVARQMVGDTEIIVPRHNAESEIAKALGL